MNENNINSEEDIKVKIIKTMLAFVPDYGWTEEALLKALQQEKLADSYSWRLFPKGISDVIQQWNLMLDHEMLDALKGVDETTLRTAEKIKIAIKTRFQLLSAHKLAMIQAWGFLSVPTHMKLKLKISYKTVNTIWYFAGDRSTDFNFYTKRGLLLGVYVTTLLCWFNDTSEDSQETWEFLDRQLQRVGYIPQVKKHIRERVTGCLSQLRHIVNRFTR